MSPELVGLVGFGVLLVLMFLGMPISVCMIVVGYVGVVVLTTNDRALAVAGQWASATLSDYTLAVLPVFLLMGEFADISGMMKDAYTAANKWLGNLPGGLAIASIVGAGAFSTVSGSSMACAAIMGRVALPQLLQHKYDPALATGALAAGGTLGNLIPPGILLVVYSILTDSSLGQLFIACYIPGALLVFMYVAQVWLQCTLKPSLGPRAGKIPWKEKLGETKRIAGLFIVFAVVLGGIWTGTFTPNEAASISTVIVFAFAVARRTVNGQSLRKAFGNTFITTGMAFAIIMGANMFTSFTALSRLPQVLASWLTGLNLSATGLVILIMLVYFILGIVMNALPMMLLTLPIFVPVLNTYHVNLVWFGVLCIIQMELANLSPPVGMNLFVIAAMAKPMGVTMGQVFRGAIPFSITMLVFNVILVFFPQIAMWLVTVMRT